MREESSGEVREPTDYIEVSWKLYENQSVDEIFKRAKRTLERMNLNPGLFRPIRFYDSTTPAEEHALQENELEQLYREGKGSEIYSNQIHSSGE